MRGFRLWAEILAEQRKPKRIDWREVEVVRDVYVIQVKVDKQWKSVHPVGGIPYEYPTRIQALNMAKDLYPDQFLLNDGKGKIRIKRMS